MVPAAFSIEGRIYTEKIRNLLFFLLTFLVWLGTYTVSQRNRAFRSAVPQAFGMLSLLKEKVQWKTLAERYFSPASGSLFP
jgi:hypothetical protein